MALMLLGDYAKFMGVHPRTFNRLHKEGRIVGVIAFNERFKIVDTESIKILPPVNRIRRLDGPRVGRSKPLRGEPGFIDPLKKNK